MNNILFVGKHTVTYSVDWHIHDSWELIYCTGGSGNLLFHDFEIPYHEDTVALIPPHTAHANKGGSGGFTNIHMNMDDISFALSEPIVFPVGSPKYLLNLFYASFFYYSRGDSERSLLLPSYGQLVVNTISLLLTEHRHSETIQMIETKILRNYPDPDFDLNGYLQTLPFSFAYLKKLFKKEMGMTPLQFLTEKRLENAAALLSTAGSRANITEVCHRCGFQEPLYFSRLFHKKYGLSPRSYQQSESEPPTVNSDDMKLPV